ncbi:MAG: glycosyltransferase [Sedimentisphaerales bacterium]|nr:glycosyltransferase [Sedimentisphaerales bacterium]
MHIAHVVRSLESHMGGGPRSAMGLAMATQEFGHTVSCWSTYGLPSEETTSEGPIAVYGFERNWPASWYRSVPLVQELDKRIHAVDVLHVHGFWSHPMLASSCLAKRNAIPMVLAPRGELNLKLVRNSLSKRLKKYAYLKSFGQTVLKRADCLQALSEREITAFRKAGYQGPVTVIPNGIDAKAYKDLPDPMWIEEQYPCLKQRRVVLFLARISPEKGLDVLLRAWSLLVARPSYRDAILILAGPDDRGYKTTARILAGRLGIADSVVFTDSVHGRQKAAFLSRSDVFVLPSYSEGFSMSVLEALACARPVLITPGCNFPEVTACHAGVCCEPQAEALEEALGHLLDMNSDQRSSMGRRGRDLVQRCYSWDHIAARIIQVYESILHGDEIPLHPTPPQGSSDVHPGRGNRETSGESAERLSVVGVTKA